jgi:hypothetical protein
MGGDSGIVDADIEAAEPRDRRRDDLTSSCFVRDVGDDRADSIRRQSGARLGQTRLVTVGREDAGSCRDEPLDHDPADATGRPGHDHDPP